MHRYECEAVTARAWLLLTVALASVLPLAGCTETLEGANPHIQAPKLTLGPTDTLGMFEVYVHSAVGERQYDSLVLRVDNVTVQSRNATYALIHRIPAGEAFLTVQATLGENVFALNALVVANTTSKKMEVVTFQGGKEAERKEVELPWNKLMEKVDPK